MPFPFPNVSSRQGIRDRSARTSTSPSPFIAQACPYKQQPSNWEEKLILAKFIRIANAHMPLKITDAPVPRPKTRMPKQGALRQRTPKQVLSAPVLLPPSMRSWCQLALRRRTSLHSRTPHTGWSSSHLKPRLICRVSDSTQTGADHSSPLRPTHSTTPTSGGSSTSWSRKANSSLARDIPYSQQKWTSPVLTTTGPKEKE